uniref:Uncharacterized protein n=1 Tax=Ditylenchus dipsaci TaxID=166011 RepID=A0A915E6G8_9BILA
MDRRLTHLLEHYVQTDDDRGVVDCLVEAVIKSCGEEIDQAIAVSPAASTSGNLFLLEQDSSNFNVVLQRRVKAVADNVAIARAFKHFRSDILSNCTALVENLWRTDAYREQLAHLRPLFLGSNPVEENLLLNYTNRNQQYTLNSNINDQKKKAVAMSLAFQCH